MQNESSFFLFDIDNDFCVYQNIFHCIWGQSPHPQALNPTQAPTALHARVAPTSEAFLPSGPTAWRSSHSTHWQQKMGLWEPFQAFPSTPQIEWEENEHFRVL